MNNQKSILGQLYASEAPKNRLRKDSDAGKGVMDRVQPRAIRTLTHSEIIQYLLHRFKLQQR